MIVEWLIGIASNIVTWLSEDVLTWEGAQPRDVWGDIEGMVAQFASIGVWIDWAAVSAAVALAIGVWLVCLTIKAIRALLAHIPQFGGAG